MFEVGKKYVNINWPNDLYECVAIHEKKGWLIFNGKPLTYDWTGNWKEYKEPRTITRWVNVYDTGDELVFGNMWTDEERAIRHGRTAEWGESKYITTFPITYTEPH